MGQAKRKEQLRKTQALVKLDLGCGQQRAAGYIGVDLVKAPGVDVVHDLTIAPWPFSDESVEDIRVIHFFEHLTGSQRIVFMEECHRILVGSSKLLIVVPYYASMRAIQDPTHQWPPLCEASFLYFNKTWRQQNKLDHYPITCNFDFTYGYGVNAAWAIRSQEARDFAVRHYFHAVDDLHVTLTKR